MSRKDSSNRRCVLIAITYTNDTRTQSLKEKTHAYRIKEMSSCQKGLHGEGATSTCSKLWWMLKSEERGEVRVRERVGEKEWEWKSGKERVRVKEWGRKRGRKRVGEKGGNGTGDGGATVGVRVRVRKRVGDEEWVWECEKEEWE